jgi:hypothetical protein
MRIAAVTLLLASLALAACNDSNDVIIAPGTRSGTFILQTVDGHGLPAVVLDSLNSSIIVEALSGSITLSTNSTFADVTDLRLTLGTVISRRTVTCAGSFTFSADTLTFVESGPTPECARTFTGILTLGTLTTSLRGQSAVYTR